MSKPRRSRLEHIFASWNRSLTAYLSRRPHRSFRRTLPRDYARSLNVPSYVGLSQETGRLLFRNWKVMGAFFFLYTIASAVVLGVVSQTNYNSLVEALQASNADIWTRSFSLFTAAITGGLNPTASTNGQAVSALLIVLAWLTLIWLLRHIVNNSQVKLREALYGAGAPLISTFLVALVGLVQCVPIIIVAVSYNAAASSGLLSGGIEAMLYYGAALLLVVLSVYWLVSTFIALVIVTLPGMYPMAALKAAGDLAVGRRLRLLLRMVWLFVGLLLIWVVILIPAILLDGVIRIAWLPLVPVCILALAGLTLMVSSTYIYLLYRKLVEDESKPA